MVAHGLSGQQTDLFPEDYRHWTAPRRRRSHRNRGTRQQYSYRRSLYDSRLVGKREHCDADIRLGLRVGHRCADTLDDIGE